MPVLILVVIAIPSFKLLYYEDVVPDADLTIKATGHQWYWSYEYPDNGDFTFDAYLVDDAELKPGQPRLLTTDNAVVVPVNTNVRLQTTATDVIHSWAVPAFGVKIDAVPGRLNETWFRSRARHLLRSVLGALRRQPRLHADHGQGGVQGRVRELGRAGQGTVRPERGDRPGQALRPEQTGARSRSWLMVLPPSTSTALRPVSWSAGSISTNHKDIGTLYLITAFIAGMIGMLISVVFRMELSRPGRASSATTITSTTC